MTRRTPTIRVRLAVLYASLVTAAGAIVVVVTYALVAALPATVNSSTILPDGQTARTSFQVPDRQDFEPQCRAALASKQTEPALRDKCVVAYQVWSAQTQHDTTLSHLLRYSLATLAVVVALAAMAGWLIAERVLRPVRTITAAARTASESNLSARVALGGPRDELRELADTFDDMLDRLQTAFQTQGRFIANASHELRTPLMLMRTSVDVVLAKQAPTPSDISDLARDVRTAVDQADKLVEALLTLARNERGLTVRDEVDLATVADDVLDSADTLDRYLHVSLDPAVTTGDPVLIERLITNLVDNAVRYNVAGGDIWVTTGIVDGQPTAVIANTGPIIAPDAAGDLFEPFHRLHDRTTRDGFGLGLAIVASIATVHDGTVTASPRPQGGLDIVLAMPRSGLPSSAITPPHHG